MNADKVSIIKIKDESHQDIYAQHLIPDDLILSESINLELSDWTKNIRGKDTENTTAAM